MVRLFTALCKSLFEIISDEDIFREATGQYSYLDEACPLCGAIGKLIPHGDYTRGLLSLKHSKISDSKLKPLRFKCESCGVTHSLLPDIVIPYGRYSLSFVIRALIAYFERETTVENICAQLNIAVSTLYSWIKRMAAHKDLMLGVLLSRKISALSFLRGLLRSGRLSDILNKFYRGYGFSFMQGRSASATRSRAP
jgi:transposase-like protein